MFIADIITREAIEASVSSAIKENSSRFPIFDIDHPEPYIEDYKIVEYYERGPKMHEMFINLAKNLRPERINS